MSNKWDFAFNFHYNGLNSYIFVNGVEVYKLKAKNFEINTALLCLDNVPKDFSVDNMRKTGLYGYAFNFSVNYDGIGVDDIWDIHKYLIKNYDIK